MLLPLPRVPSQDTAPQEKGDNLMEDHTSDVQIIDLYAGIGRLVVSTDTVLLACVCEGQELWEAAVVAGAGWRRVSPRRGVEEHSCIWCGRDRRADTPVANNKLLRELYKSGHPVIGRSSHWCTFCRYSWGA